jgi:hypothetical protein
MADDTAAAAVVWCDPAEDTDDPNLEIFNSFIGAEMPPETFEHLESVVDTLQSLYCDDAELLDRHRSLAVDLFSSFSRGIQTAYRLRLIYQSKMQLPTKDPVYQLMTHGLHVNIRLQTDSLKTLPNHPLLHAPLRQARAYAAYECATVLLVCITVTQQDVSAWPTITELFAPSASTGLDWIICQLEKQLPLFETDPAFELLLHDAMSLATIVKSI